MDPISSAFGLMAAIPQCIEAAKQLYDLRERFDQAAVLITAIYTESMVVAASLSQIENILQGTTLQTKPELRHTLDRALTGCWVVYQCLDEEVRDLAQKVDVNDLRKRDRARFLVKEANFKELLQQIRGQQSALGLLIQGLQMESLSDMHRLLNNNSVKLDQIAKRSNTLRQKHPNIRVPPECVLDTDSLDGPQTGSVEADFTFDDEVVNSIPYQKVIARATNMNSRDEPQEDVKAIDGNFSDRNTVPDNGAEGHQVLGGMTPDIKSLLLQIDDAIVSNNNDAPPPYEGQGSKSLTDEKAHDDILDDLEKSMLPFMPPVSTSTQPSVILTGNESTEASREWSITESRTPATLSVSLAEEPEEILSSPDAHNSRTTFSQRPLKTTGEDQEEEKPPPLPPRRVTSPLLAPTKSEPKSVSSWDEIFAPLGTTASFPLTSPSSDNKISQPRSKDLSTSPPPLSGKPSSLFSPRTELKDIAPSTSTAESDPGSIWASIMRDEEKYIERMNKFTNIFYGVVVKDWPFLEKHMEAIVVARQLPPLHQEFILDVVKEQTTKNAFAVCDPRLFATWAINTYRVLKEYSRRFPHALYALRLTQSRDHKFSPCIEAIGLNLNQIGQSWEDHLALPIAQLDTYITKLQGIAQWLNESPTPEPAKEQSRITAVIETLHRLKAQCFDLTEKSIRQEEIQSLHRRVHTVDTSLVDVLELTAPNRRIVYQGPLALKLKSRGPWQPMQVFLLDNYVFWGKAKSMKDPNHKGIKNDNIRVIEKPVPVKQIAIRLPGDLSKTRKSSYLDELPRGVTLYELFIDVVVTPSIFTTHTIGASSSEERNTWYQKLSEVAGTRITQTII